MFPVGSNQVQVIGGGLSGHTLKKRRSRSASGRSVNGAASARPMKLARVGMQKWQQKTASGLRKPRADAADNKSASCPVFLSSL